MHKLLHEEKKRINYQDWCGIDSHFHQSVLSEKKKTKVKNDKTRIDAYVNEIIPMHVKYHLYNGI